MNRLTFLLTALLGLGTLAPLSTAEAGHSCSTRTSCCSHCGGRVYYVLQTVGYDCHGCPIRRWVAQYHRCTPPPCYHQNYYSRGSSHSHGGHYSRSSNSCNGGSRSSWSFGFHFGR